MAIEIIGGAVAAAAGLGAWMRWTVKPVIIAYHVGRGVERLVADPARYGPAFKAGLRIGYRDRHRDSR